jgi:glycosyltransferase involved in cell wall biosynthesis
MKNFVFIVSSPLTARSFLQGHITALSEIYEIDLIANYSDGCMFDVDVRSKINVRIERNINIFSDLWAIFTLIRVLARGHYDVVHTVTPKAGLLGMIAAWITRVPVRHHTYTGQVWATRTGVARHFLRFLDRVIYLCSTRVLVDSHSQRDFLISEGVVSHENSFVLASGSISGVDTVRFSPDDYARYKIRQQYEIHNNDVVLLFLGRINREKGVPELLRAFREINSELSHVKLMVVGPDEDGIFEDHNFVESFGGSLIKVGFTHEPPDYFKAADVFCLPSHREGFGTVILEAAACGIPSVASNIYGLSDAVVDGITGLLHRPKSIDDLREKLTRLVLEPELRHRLAINARKRAVEKFSSAVVEQAMIDFYRFSCAANKK